MEYYLVEVFGQKVPEGKGVLVVFHKKDLGRIRMLELVKKMKQTETIFLREIKEDQFEAKVFAAEKYVQFLSDALIGGMGAIHKRYFRDESISEAIIELDGQSIEFASKKMHKYCEVTTKKATFGKLSGKVTFFSAGVLLTQPKKHVHVEKRYK